MTQWKDPVAVRREKIWRILRPIAATLLSLGLVALAMIGAIRYVLSHFVYPVDADDNTPIQVEIPTGASASRIASILYNVRGQDEPGLIVSTASFKVYVDFTGKANALKAGTYVLSRNMTIPEIVNILCAGNEARRVTRFTIPEGYTAVEIAQALFETGILEDQEEFLALCKDGTLLSVGYLDQLLNPTDRRYALEGYLFPDTYEIYEDAAPVDILKKMLNRFAIVFTEEDAERARSMNMTTDQILTLASMIEKEAAADEDFARVSAVFHNRIRQGMPLESCATLSYTLGVNHCSNRIGILTSHGYQIAPQFFAGVGVGFNYFYEGYGDVFGLPVFAHLRSDILENEITPFIDLRVGYSLLDVNRLLTSEWVIHCLM